MSDFWWRTYDLGATSPQKNPNFSEISHWDFTTLQISTSLARGRHTYWCSDLFSSTAARVFNKLTYLLTYTVFEPILQCVPQMHCNPSSYGFILHSLICSTLSPSTCTAECCHLSQFTNDTCGSSELSQNWSTFCTIHSVFNRSADMISRSVRQPKYALINWQ